MQHSCIRALPEIRSKVRFFGLSSHFLKGVCASGGAFLIHAAKAKGMLSFPSTCPVRSSQYSPYHTNETLSLNAQATSFVSPKWVPQLADAASVMEKIARRPGMLLYSGKAGRGQALFRISISLFKNPLTSKFIVLLCAGVRYPVLTPNLKGLENALKVCFIFNTQHIVHIHGQLHGQLFISKGKAKFFRVPDHFLSCETFLLCIQDTSAASILITISHIYTCAN